MLDYSRIDEMAISGYQYAAGEGSVPELFDQLDIDAFNAGIRNYNGRHDALVPQLFVRTRIDRDGANGAVSDKELAIVGA